MFQRFTADVTFRYALPEHGSVPTAYERNMLVWAKACRGRVLDRGVSLTDGVVRAFTIRFHALASLRKFLADVPGGRG